MDSMGCIAARELMKVLGVESLGFLVHLEEISFSCNSWNRIMGMIIHTKRLGP